MLVCPFGLTNGAVSGGIALRNAAAFSRISAASVERAWRSRSLA
jgi:hypothetical protein